MAISVRSGLAWLMLSQGSFFVLQFGGSVVLARLLTPYEMGIYAVAFACTNLLNTLRSLSLNNFLIRERQLTQEAIATAFTVTAIIAVITAAGILGLSFAGGFLFGDPGVQHVLSLLAVLPLISQFEFLPAALLERDGAFRTIAVINMARVATATAVTVLLAFDGFSYMSIAWGNLAGTLLNAASLTILGWRHVSLRVSLADWRRVTDFGLQMFTISAVMNIASQFTDVLLGRIVGLGALGLYSRAAGLYNLLWDNLHAVIGRVVMVDFAERRRRGLALNESYLRIVAMITGLLWPAFSGLGILAGPVILTIYGPTWTVAALPLSLLCAAGVVLTSATMVVEIYITGHETNRLLRYELKRATLGVSLFTLGCFGGLPWAAAARIGEAVGVVLFCKKDLERITGTASAEYGPIYRHSALLAIAACAPAAALMAAHGWSPATPLHEIAAAIATGMVAWSAMLWWLRHPLFDEAEAAFRRHLRPAAQVD